MPNITIDNTTYDLDTLNDEARAQLTNLQFVDAELARLTNQTAVLQNGNALSYASARTAYSKALQAALPSFVGDTMKFN